MPLTTLAWKRNANFQKSIKTSTVVDLNVDNISFLSSRGGKTPSKRPVKGITN